MPRIDVVETEIFKFNELSDEAKAKARYWYRADALDYEWWDGVYEQVETAGRILGIDFDSGRRTSGNKIAVFFSGFCSQGDGACFEGTWSYKKGWRKALLHEFGPGDTLNELLSIGQALTQAAAPQFYRLDAVCRHRGHYYHSGCMTVEVTHQDEMYRDIGDAEEDVRDALRSFADWIYSSLEKEHDWLLADAQVDEALTINEYEFTAEGGHY